MPYAGIRDFDDLEKWLVGLITKPMDPRAQSFGCWDVDGSSKKGLESSSFARDDFCGGITSPFHSQSQHRRERLSTSSFTERPEYAFKVWWFSTLRKIPVSAEGDIADEASA